MALPVAGRGCSVTPDLCILSIDIRTIPSLDGTAASAVDAVRQARMIPARRRLPS
ncbi:MAG: hypothetical protein ACRDRI_02070 [Pseudonocardiaceae bacterium]